MAESELLQIYSILVKARSPYDVFGPLLTADNVSERYKSLVKITHPDHYQGNKNLLYVAEQSTMFLNGFYAEAKDIISGKTPKPNVSSKNPQYSTHFTIGDCEYGLFSRCIESNFYKLYFGERKCPSGVEEICFKISKDIDDNPLLSNESRILKTVMHKSMPVLIDNFISNNGNEVNVMRRIKGSHDLVSIKKMYPKGVPQEHVVWIMDRLLSVIGYLHSNNVIHGGIEPSNTLITDFNHNVLLTDFTLAIENAHEPGMKYAGVNEFSAPEIDGDAKPHPSTDMYSFGKIIEYIITDERGDYVNVDKRLKEFVAGFLQEDPSVRTYDAWESWHKLKELRLEIFGSKSQFLPFNVKRV
jgi:serine/threonine protein kinase